LATLFDSSNVTGQKTSGKEYGNLSAHCLRALPAKFQFIGQWRYRALPPQRRAEHNRPKGGS